MTGKKSNPTPRADTRAHVDRAARRARRTGATVPTLPADYQPASAFEAGLLEGMLDVITMEHGGRVPGSRTSRVTAVTARKAAAVPAPEYSAAHIKRLRAKMKLSQAVFAQALNVSAATVRAWEIGQKSPSGAALRLLQWADRHPRLVLAEVQAR